MQEAGQRLRYLTCAHIEDSLGGILPHASIQQFGSSASGLAQHNSDLDMALSVSIPDHYQQVRHRAEGSERKYSDMTGKKVI